MATITHREVFEKLVALLEEAAGDWDAAFQSLTAYQAEVVAVRCPDCKVRLAGMVSSIVSLMDDAEQKGVTFEEFTALMRAVVQRKLKEEEQAEAAAREVDALLTGITNPVVRAIAKSLRPEEAIGFLQGFLDQANKSGYIQ